MNNSIVSLLLIQIILIEELVGELQENPSISETAEPQIRQLDCDTKDRLLY